MSPALERYMARIRTMSVLAEALQANAVRLGEPGLARTIAAFFDVSSDGFQSEASVAQMEKIGEAGAQSKAGLAHDAARLVHAYVRVLQAWIEVVQGVGKP
jgi:hypothetical protein